MWLSRSIRIQAFFDQKIHSFKMEKNKTKAVGLLSGGLDSTLAAKLMLEQGIEVYAVNFTSPFCTCTPKHAGCAAVVTAVKELGNIPLKQVALRDEYLEMVQKPKHGYGSGMNPCIDCRIMKIKKAGDYMREIDAAFLFTGEVLGQRPMSQHKHALELIERESGLKGFILRPLSAARLEPTIPELNGLVDRSKLLGIAGRSRKRQMSIAAEKAILDYPCSAGGCLLTDRHFADKMRDYLAFTKHPSVKDIALLKIGRHFRLVNGDKIIVARNKQECKMMKSIHHEQDHLLFPLDFSGPSVILQGSSLCAAVEKMIQYSKGPIQEAARLGYLFKGQNRIEYLSDFI
jgi:tRNA U34 2-thiouridine synthase MnmA/TrmU